MVEIPESLLRRSAEAKAKALGVPVEQVLAEMKGEAPPTRPEPPADAPAAPKPRPGATADVSEPPATEPEPEEAPGEEPSAEAEVAVPEGEAPDTGLEPESLEAGQVHDTTPPPETEMEEESAPGVATITEEAPPSPDGEGNGKVAAMVSPRPVAPPTGTPEGVRTQRLLTVVKARAIQQVKAEPTDKVNTWPHLMLSEFVALLAMTGFLVILSVILQAPLLEPANFNATPNPSKAPWYFLGLQELLSYFDPQIAGVTVPTVIGLIGFMFIPYVDRNPSTKPSDRKFAIMLFTFFLAGSATLTILGVLFRAEGFNFAYPWEAGVFFDDLKDWVQFEGEG
jgi:menaquinol-cytochrome c reductase cytochrome b/c subunit